VLVALGEQDHVDRFETVVVSDGSEDGTDEYLRSERVPIPVVALHQANSGPAAARNHGFGAASGELILFLDDDVVPTPALVREHVAAHVRFGDRAVVIGPMLNPPDHDMTMWIRYEQAMLAKQYDAMERGDWSATSRQFYTGNASILKKHLVSAGGFDTELRRAEDIELALRLDSMGLEFTYVPEAIGLHYAERSFESWREIARAYGRSDVSFASAPGREELLRFVMVQSRRRNVLVKGVVRLAAGRPTTTRVVTRTFTASANVGNRLGLDSVTRLSLSGIYNLSYYSGVVEALGGRSEYWRRRRHSWRPSTRR
jgi:GT2 family glycosyltransferase